MLDFEHRHRCEGCQLVWEHDPGTGIGNVPAKQYRPASRGLSHCCPGCGSSVLHIYEGPQRINVSHYAAWTRPLGVMKHGQAVGAGVR